MRTRCKRMEPNKEVLIGASPLIAGLNGGAKTSIEGADPKAAWSWLGLGMLALIIPIIVSRLPIQRISRIVVASSGAGGYGSASLKPG